MRPGLTNRELSVRRQTVLMSCFAKWRLSSFVVSGVSLCLPSKRRQILALKFMLIYIVTGMISTEEEL